MKKSLILKRPLADFCEFYKVFSLNQIKIIDLYNNLISRPLPTEKPIIDSVFLRTIDNKIFLICGQGLKTNGKKEVLCLIYADQPVELFYFKSRQINKQELLIGKELVSNPCFFGKIKEMVGVDTTTCFIGMNFAECGVEPKIIKDFFRKISHRDLRNLGVYAF